MKHTGKDATVVAVTWHRSTYSSGGNNCVEAASPEGLAGAWVRDSKTPQRGHFPMAAEPWLAFLAAVKNS